MRLCIIATKLALLDLSYKSTGSRAIVVFDDVLSELDEIRQTQILEKVPKDNQIFITCAQSKEQIKRLLKKGKMFKMTDGQLETEE
jgi:DNA replication and repair protein RecF